MSDAIVIKKLVKKFGDFTALAGLDLDVKQGELFGLLGPNGAGKTTTINIIMGLLSLTSGVVHINGLDISQNPEKIKNMIGVMTQETIVETELTGKDNLRLFADLYHVPESEIEDRVKESLAEADLTSFGDTRAGTFSGGMQRRLALVRCMIHDPKILILDEPTTGLDVQNRVSMWGRIRKLNEQGVTIILTTQYLEEADALCERIAIIDHGKIKAVGTPSELKKMVGTGNILEVVTHKEDIPKASRVLKEEFKLEPIVKVDRINAEIERDSFKTMSKINERLRKEKVEVLAIGLHLPTLDDVFIKLTGSSFRDSTGADTSRNSVWANR